MDKLTFENMLDEIKETGETERQTIENAEELARIINSLASARVKANLTQRELAQKSGIKQSAIARMETLQVVPRLDTVIKIARCLEIKLVINQTIEKVYNNIVPFYSDVYGKEQSSYRWINERDYQQSAHVVAGRNINEAFG